MSLWYKYIELGSVKFSLFSKKYLPFLCQHFDYLVFSGKDQLRIIIFYPHKFFIVLIFPTLAFVIKILVFGFRIFILFIQMLILVIHKLHMRSISLKTLPEI